jgi:hypothetical protein
LQQYSSIVFCFPPLASSQADAKKEWKYPIEYAIFSTLKILAGLEILNKTLNFFFPQRQRVARGRKKIRNRRSGKVSEDDGLTDTSPVRN